MKIKYKILYKNGFEDEIVQEGTEEELTEINECILSAFNNDATGSLTFGDGKKEGYFIRIEDVSRVLIDVVDQ